MKLLGLGVIFQLLVCVAVGVRLLALWRRTRLLPELAFGLSFVALGALGYPLSIAARTGLAGEASGTLLSLALAAQNFASLALFVGTWRVFRPLQRWVGVAVALFGAAFVASLAAPFVVADGAAARDAGFWYYLGFGGRLGCFAWAAFESIRYTRLLVKRLPLGLVDPIVADRFRLWSISTTTISVGFLVFLAGRLLTDNVGASAWVLGTTSLIGLVAGTSMWIAFFPPERYLRRFVAADR